jgi:orotidine-5'-phosphate decarboxylase
MPESPLIVALDFSTVNETLSLVDKLDPADCRLKVGKQLFTAQGPELVRQLVRRGFDVFLDLKFHDIPATVELACRAARDLGVWMMNVHALGGGAMMRAARAGVGDDGGRPLLIAVTVLTSMGEGDLQETGIAGTTEQAVLRLAHLAQQNGMDGVVCSAQEAGVLRHELGEAFCLVTPGIRSAQAAADDQCRTMTAAAACAAGSHYLVVGRPVTRAADPLASLRQLQQEIQGMCAK